ncbi:maleate cis-trans isomerase family protein [Jannaschia sp. CCS1]|uniref:maleate cis-trans isomerase family protein n=1 Tax=Jannaschia sp. (strain CCS1) TaxID=290400 RepID=UPI000053BFAF|nr:Asp/Glu racemase [Jannaschia sp. CCS1]ABD56690.1 Asp/Glu racemase [Jannaschia sp. CCS1]
MSVAYAPKGLVGVLTPQANTTVEPEMAILTPPGHAFINGRLTSDKATIPDRLRDYFDRYAEAAAQFANAPVLAIGFACTGASYLAGVAREDETLADLSRDLGVPIFTAASAVVDALDALDATRIALLSPYDAALDDASAGYWTARGRKVVARTSTFESTDAFHPIYAMAGDRAESSLGAVSDAGAEAIIMLGTGMPTLQSISRFPRVGDAVLLSCMSCFAWRLYCASRGEAATRESLLTFHDDPTWRQRLASWISAAP